MSGDRNVVGGPEVRYVELPVSPFDSLVIARIVSVLVLTLAVANFDDVPTSLVVALLGVALLQPVLALIWRFQGSFRQAQLVFDIGAFALFVALMPDYYWLCSIVLVAVVANHAVLSPINYYVVASMLTVVVMAVTGVALGVEHAMRAVAIAGILMAGLGVLGHRTRLSMRESRGDVLHALGAAGGLAHLTDLNAGVVDVVGDTQSVVGWSRDEWMSLDHRELLHPDDIEAFWIDPEAVSAGDLLDRTARVRTRDGRWIWFRDVSRVVMHHNRPHIRGFGIDVSSHHAGLMRVTNEALTDDLTGLANRRALLGELEERRDGSAHHLVLIDLDGFKDVNDTLGHESGDQLLIVLAERFSRCLRPADVLARLGGDEFAIVIDAFGQSSHVQATVDRIALEISRPVEIAGVNLTMSFSAGIVAARSGEADASTMLRRADIAMYAAKRTDASWALFDAALEQAAAQRVVLANSLPDALADGSLRLHYQPIFDTASGRIVAGEGLARWEHDTYGLIGPEVFLDVVLMSDRSGDFTRAMVLDAIGTVSRLTEAGSEVTVAVNLPIRALDDAEFARWFADACAAASVAPERLTFEIAEGDIHDATSVTTSIDRLADLGVRISVDDFGAGHATFERLQWRNVAQLKLDRSVVVNAAADERALAVLRSVVALAQELGYELVAEGVENRSQHRLLRELGCALVQGFLFCGVLPPPDFIDLAVGSVDAPRDRAAEPSASPI